MVCDVVSDSCGREKIKIAIDEFFRGALEAPFQRLSLWKYACRLKLAPPGGTPCTVGQVTSWWQLWTLMIISKGSGYELSSHLLRSVMLYLNTQWQAVVSNSAQATGPYSSMEWLPSDTYDKALWG